MKSKNGKRILIAIPLMLFIFSVNTLSLNASSNNECIASVNGKEYASLSDAINDSKSGSRIVIHKQISTDDTLIINKDIEIDFNGNSYNYTGNDTAFNILNGTVTITNR